MPSVHNKYHNTAPPEAVYIGRPSVWGNPFTVKAHGRGKALELYRTWIESPAGAHIREKARKELRGKDLVCFCKPKDCHGDILLEIANYEDERTYAGLATTGKQLLEGEYAPIDEVIVGLGWGQWDGPGTEGYCRPIYSTPVSPEENTTQETHDKERTREGS